MTNYYIEKGNKIVFTDTDKARLQRTVGEDVEILETERPIALSEDGTYYVFADTDEYLQEQTQKEKERIAILSLTRGDVFRGLLQAKGVTKQQIANMIEAMPASTPEETVTKSLAIIDFEDALHYYRGVELINTIGFALGISKEQLDNFFIKGNDPDPHIKEEAYKELM